MVDNNTLFDGTKRIITKVFEDSSLLKQAVHDSATDGMRLEFWNGELYDYGGISRELFNKFINAPSAGQYFHKHIRKLFPTKKVK